MIKSCSKCHRYFPATTEFFRASTRDSSGTSAICRACLGDVDKLQAVKRGSGRRGHIGGIDLKERAYVAWLALKVAENMREQEEIAAAAERRKQWEQRTCTASSTGTMNRSGV